MVERNMPAYDRLGLGIAGVLVRVGVRPQKSISGAPEGAHEGIPQPGIPEGRLEAPTCPLGVRDSLADGTPAPQNCEVEYETTTNKKG